MPDTDRPDPPVADFDRLRRWPDVEAPNLFAVDASDRLILDEAGRKLSKSTDATGLRELRAGGATPADIRRLVGLA